MHVVSMNEKNTSCMKSCLGSNSSKLSIFRAVMDVCQSREKPHSCWPLFLPSIQHALVTTCLISDPTPHTAKDAAPERFICDMMLQSITDALKKPITVVENLRLHRKNNIQLSDEEVPLSIRDARLFVIALGNLQKKDQVKLLNQLISTFSSEMLKIQQDDELREFVTSEKDFAGFLSRIITMTSNLIDLVSSGKLLFDSLRNDIGLMQYFLPCFIEVDSDINCEEGDWYKKQSCFMGLWSEWESSSISPVAGCTYTCALKNDELSMFSSSIEVAMDIGLDSGL